MNTQMKKTPILLFIVALLLMFSACGAKEGSRIFVHEEGGINNEIEYIYKGDKVTQVNVITEMDYDVLGYNDKEEAEEDLSDFMEFYQGKDGMTQEMEFDEDKLIDVLSVNYNEVELSDTEGIPGLEGVVDGKNGISMKKTADQLIDSGYTEE